MVDTSAWICFYARRGFTEIKNKLTALLEEDRVANAGLNWLTIKDSHWHQAANLGFRLRRKGITITSIDAIIAIITIDSAAALLHYDQDFKLISDHSDLEIY